jgi:hypothetical protein
MKMIAHALDSARRQFQRASKDGTNPHLRNRYPTLDSILEAVEPALEAYGLTWIQSVETDPALQLRTTLVHLDSGEKFECVIPLLTDGGGKINPMQALGSAITYARRYGIECALGVLREDDDAEGAYHRPNGSPPAHYPQHDRPRSSPVADRAPQRALPGPAPAARPAGPASDRRPHNQAADHGGERIPPFENWVKSAAAALEVEQQSLLQQLHDAMVGLGRMAAVEPHTIFAAFNRRWNDSLQGANWRQWLKEECRILQSRIVEAGL